MDVDVSGVMVVVVIVVVVVEIVDVAVVSVVMMIEIVFSIVVAVAFWNCVELSTTLVVVAVDSLKFTEVAVGLPVWMLLCFSSVVGVMIDGDTMLLHILPVENCKGKGAKVSV